MMTMTKTEVLRDLDRQFPSQGMLSAVEVQNYLGISPQASRAFLTGVSFLRFGTRKRFLKEAIAERVAERREA